MAQFMLFLQSSRQKQWKSLCFLCIVLMWTFSTTTAYFVGDPVNTKVYMVRDTGYFLSETEEYDATMAQSPLFGRETSTRLEYFKTTQEEGSRIKSFSLSFEGLHQLPWIHVDSSTLEDKGMILQVQLQYSNSGAGHIHSVFSEQLPPGKGAGNPGVIEIQYNWVEQENLAVMSGAILMYLSVLIISVMALMQSCGLSDDDFADDEGTSASTYDHSDPGMMSPATSWGGLHGD